MSITAKTRMQSRINSMIMLVLIIVLSGLLAWLSTRYSVVMDWTHSGRHTLSTASQEVLSLMEDPIEITAYARENNDLRTAIKKIVGRYQRIKPDIILRFVNPDAVPDEVRNLGVSINGEMVARYQQRTEHIKSGSEEEFTNALQRLLRATEHWVAFIEGHGERSPLGDGNFDLKNWVNQLTSRGYRAQPVNLAQVQAIPENTRILVIAGPGVELLPGEIALIIDYLDQGGNLLWLADPGEMHGLERIAEYLQINIPEGIIVDYAGKLIGISDPTFALVTSSMYFPHATVQNFDYTTIFPVATTIEAEENDIWRTSTLMETGDHTWQETGKLEGEVAFDEGSDIPGPLTIGISLEREIELENSDNKQQRIIVIGDGDFLSNTYLSNSGNLDLGLRLINWLSNEDDFIDIPTRTIEDTRLEFSTFASVLIGFGFLIILPLIFLGSGFTIWWQRRKS